MLADKWSGRGTSRRQGGFSGLQVLSIVLLVMALTAGVTFWIVRSYIFPSPFTPVTLTQQEEQRLDLKLSRLGWPLTKQETRPGGRDKPGLEPQAYREADGDRRLLFSEKEVNAMLGRNPDFAQRVAIDFSDNLASAKILVPIPKDFPVMAGEIIRVNAGLDIHLDAAHRPVVALVGVSLMGVPLPNAWLGNMKNVNLVSEFGGSGFWTTFADGVEDLQVRDGELYLKLRP